MIITPDTRETDKEHIGVHVQDEQGVCISLGQADGWHWISNECRDDLVALLRTTPRPGHDPNCLHCELCVEASYFLSTHPDKSNHDMACEVLQFAAQFVVHSTHLTPEEAVAKLTAEMRQTALEWVANEMAKKKKPS